MIIKHVQHFLNEEGQKFFPQWIKATKEHMKDFDGFIDFYQAELHESKIKTTFFFLIFDTAENLNKWGESEIHNQVINQLIPFMQQQWKAVVYQIK